MTLALAAGLAACSDDGDDSAKKGEDAPGEVVGSGDRYEASIRRTTDGVPHITGATLADASFGQGYASGQDRSCDLADQVVKIRGERAKFLGAGDDNANIDSDVAWKTIGIFELATEDWADFPKEGAALVTAFTDGWNAHLAEVGVDGLAGWCKGADWVRPIEPVEIYAYARSIALQASSGAVAGYIPSAVPPDVEAGDGSTNSTSSTTSTSAPDDTSNGTPTTAAPTSAPSSSPTTASTTDATDTEEALRPLAELTDAPIASNGWAIGSERSADGGGMLVANPHFPWEGELRFWEVHLTVPGEVDIYGVQLSGLPGIGIGFTEDFGWTHTVSAGNRFTAYKLTLEPGSPTSYRYGDEVREMTANDLVIEVKGDDGELSEVKHTTWSSHYGPIIDFPGFGWTDEATITFRDANIDNDEFLEQYLMMMQADDLDEFINIHEKVNGVPLFNTIATSADGRAWYADTSATPNLSDEALADYEASLAADPIVKIAADSGAILLDGSDPVYEWVDEPGARDPGLVPAAEQPQMERADYVFNANDSFWLANAQELLAGDYSPLHGRQGTVRSQRTRENAVVLDDATAEGAAGADGKFTLDELADASLLNQGFMARELRADVAARCEGFDTIDVPAGEAGEEVPALPAESVDIAEACEVLADWDGIYDLDSVGAALWREFLEGWSSEDMRDVGALWADAFDPTQPVETPSGLAPAPDGGFDPVLVNLARAVQALDVAGYPVDVKLGDVQFALRDGQRIPIHGGTGLDGTTNVVGDRGFPSILDPAFDALKRTKLVPGSNLARIDGETGYYVNGGTSFLLALDFTADGPRAKAFLAYGDTEDRSDPNYTSATERFSKKDWRDVAFTEAAVVKAQVGKTMTVRG